jgi:hypothetical protein
MVMLRPILSLAVAVMMLSTAARTQIQIRYLPTAPGVWKPWVFYAFPDDRRRLAAPPADVKALDVSLQGLSAILKKTPGFAAPAGFSVVVAGGLELESLRPGQPAAKTLPIPANFLFGAFGVYEFTRNGIAVREDTGETSMLVLFVNHLALPLFYQSDPIPEFEKLETDVERLAEPQADLFGMPRYGHTIVLKKNPAPIWTAVSREEALSLATRGIERRLTESRDVVARLQKGHDDFVDPAQQAKRIADYKTAAAYSKDPAKTLESLMKAEERIQAEASTMAKPIADASARVAVGERELAAAKTAAAALSATERAAPACYAANETVSLARFQGQPGGRCTALVRPNWKMFNPALPRSAPQILVISKYEACMLPQNLPHPGGCVANRKLLETMDKQAILDWLR